MSPTQAADRARALRLLLAYLKNDPDVFNFTEREFAGTHQDSDGFEVSGCPTCSGPLTELTELAGDILLHTASSREAAITLVTSWLDHYLKMAGPEPAGQT
jgi:hypothetical protein